MERLVYELDKNWPTTEHAIAVFKNIISIGPIESLEVTHHENLVMITIDVLAENLSTVQDLAGKIMSRARP